MEPCEWDSIYKIRVLRVFLSPSDTVFHSVSLFRCFLLVVVFVGRREMLPLNCLCLGLDAPGV